MGEVGRNGYNSRDTRESSGPPNSVYAFLFSLSNGFGAFNVRGEDTGDSGTRFGGWVPPH